MQTPTISSSNTCSLHDGCRIIRIRPLTGETYAPGSVRTAIGQYTLLWTTNSETTLWIDMQPYRASRATVFFIRPGQVYRCELHPDLDGYEVSFSAGFLAPETEHAGPSFFNPLLRLFASQQLSLSHDTIVPLQELIERMFQEWNNRHKFGTGILRRYLNILLLSIGRDGAGRSPDSVVTPSGAYVFERFAALLEKEYKRKKMVADYAAQMCVTPNYLNEVVKKITGRSAGQHIRRRVVLEAQRTAASSTYSMKEIAYMLGFTDPCHFSKFFKKTTGITFLDYKRNSAASAGYYSS